jgi:hypothetical protein
MDWLKITTAIALVAMFFFILPTARRMVKNSPKGSFSDWMSFALPMALVALLIIVLISFL